MNAPEAIFSIEFVKHCSATKFMGDFIQGQGLIVFPDDGLI